MMQLKAHEAAVIAIEQHLTRWNNGSGGVVVISAEPGMGKTALLDQIEQRLAQSSSVSIRVNCRPPIGNINASAIQPLQPFGAAIEQLYTQSGGAARKRLALNVGMSLLASIPIAGDLFYAVKAISQDVSEYKRDTAAVAEKKRSAVTECVTTLATIAEKTPFVLLIDDAQWSDSQSVEVLRQLPRALQALPLLVVCMVCPSVAQRSNLPLTSLIRTDEFRRNTYELLPATAADVEQIAQTVVPELKLSTAIRDVILERSAGNPGIVAEYVRFLHGAGHVRQDGTVDEAAFDSIRIATGSHPATDVVLRDMQEEDATLLSLCAAEGREFTAFMQASLGNVDVLTIIRTLRRLERSTGIIRSIGVRTRYGVKTTSYEFADSFPYTYFLHRPEYEERRNIHQRISEILQREFATTNISELRDLLAVHIAVHGAEAEDNGVVERMLGISADAAVRTGSETIAEMIRTEILPQYGLGNIDVELEAPTSSAVVNVDDVLRTMTMFLVDAQAEQARVLGMSTLASAQRLTQRERMILTCLTARAATAMHGTDDALVLLQSVQNYSFLSPEEECILQNTLAAIHITNKNYADALQALRKGAAISADLPTHLRALTIGNIVLAMRATNSPDTARYERSMQRLATSHGWNAVRSDLNL